MIALVQVFSLYSTILPQMCISLSGHCTAPASPERIWAALTGWAAWNEELNLREASTLHVEEMEEHDLGVVEQSLPFCQLAIEQLFGMLQAPSQRTPRWPAQKPAQSFIKTSF